MKVSIILATFNGELYLKEQLDSLRKQTRPADEVLIFDDASEDGTVALILDYIDKYSLSDWKVTVNDIRLGWKKNFIKAMEAASGELVFPCDQDDVWARRKIEKMASIMESRTAIQLLVANYEKLVPDGLGGWKTEREKGTYGDCILKKWEFDKKMLYIYRPGCTYCYRKSLYDLARKYTFEDYPYDALLWRTALALDGLALYSYLSLRYRRHGDNAEGVFIRSNETMMQSFQYYLDVLDKLEELCNDCDVQDKEKKISIIEKSRKFMELRMDVFSKKKVLGKKSYASLIPYFKYYPALTSLPGDLVKMFGATGSDHK